MNFLFINHQTKVTNEYSLAGIETVLTNLGYPVSLLRDFELGDIYHDGKITIARVKNEARTL